jgi:hypothetical protein
MIIAAYYRISEVASSTSQVRASAMLFLPIVGNLQVQTRSGL